VVRGCVLCALGPRFDPGIQRLVLELSFYLLTFFCGEFLSTHASYKLGSYYSKEGSYYSNQAITIVSKEFTIVSLTYYSK
jgi:hypothetical protein